MIWILLDACRAGNLSCYGYERPTSPNMDRLAAEGVLFEQNYSQGAWTRVSVPSCMTGRYFPVQCVYLKNEPELYKVPPKREILFPEIMSANGYWTAMISGHAYIVPPARLIPAFDEYIRLLPPEGAPYPNFEAHNAEILPWLEKHRNERFFLYVHLLDTHMPSMPAPPHDLWLPEGFTSDQIKDGQPVDLGGRTFSDADKEYLRGAHDGEIHYSDDQIQRIVEKLRDLNLLDNTILVINSDHGDALGEDGHTWGHYGPHHDELIHVPLIMRGPGIPAGRRVDCLTENADIVPTMIDLLGLKSRAKPDGKSLVRVMRKPEAKPLHEFVMTYCIGQVLIRTKEYKYVRHLDFDRELLYRVPDRVADRVDVAQEHPDELEGMRRRMDRRIMPLYKAYQNLPLELPAGQFELTPNGLYAEPKDAFVGGDPSQRDIHADNKWEYKYLDGSFWSNAAREDAPPVTLRFQMPNGRYRAELEMYTRKDYNGRPASALMVKAEDEAEFRRLVADYDAPGKQGYLMVPLGDYTVRDQSFDITIDESDKGHWAYFRRILLTAIDEHGEPIPLAVDTHRDETEQQLRALGYLE